MSYGEYFVEKQSDGSDIQESEAKDAYLEDLQSEEERFSEED